MSEPNPTEFITAATDAKLRTLIDDYAVAVAWRDAELDAGTEDTATGRAAFDAKNVASRAIDAELATLSHVPYAEPDKTPWYDNKTPWWGNLKKQDTPKPAPSWDDVKFKPDDSKTPAPQMSSDIELVFVAGPNKGYAQGHVARLRSDYPTTAVIDLGDIAKADLAMNRLTIPDFSKYVGVELHVLGYEGGKTTDWTRAYPVVSKVHARLINHAQSYARYNYDNATRPHFPQ